MNSDFTQQPTPAAVAPHKTWLPGIVTVAFLAFVFLASLQTDVNGSTHDYMIDVGEIQVALNVGGTIHYTGYPLFTVLSTLLVGMARTVGIGPAAAASGAALVWSLLALLVMYRLIWLLTGDTAVSAAMVLVMGAVETVWVHSVVAEVYSFSLLCMALAWWLALRLKERWVRWEWWAICLVVGTAVAHHRLLLIFAPSLILLTISAWWGQPQRWRLLLQGVLAFLLPFLAYLYLPLRAWQGAVWVYGQPGHWAGFWEQFTGSEVTGGLIRAPKTVADGVENGRFLWSHLTRQLPAGLLVLGGMGLTLLTYRQGRVGWALLWSVVGVSGFVWLFPRAVWAPAALMPGLVFWLVGLAVLLAELDRRWRWARWLVVGTSVLLALGFFRTNQPFIQSLTDDPAGRQVITTLQAIPPEAQPGTVVLPWGTAFFAAAYGRYVTGELPRAINLVDHRANFGEIFQREGRLLTPTLTANFWPAEWWRERLGDVHFDLAAPDVVTLIPEARLESSSVPDGFDLGNGILVVDTAVTETADGQLVINLSWQAKEPIAQNYSVAVHLVAADPPQGPQDILAQADAIHPVSGYAPTSGWLPGVPIQDMYLLPVPAGSQPQSVRVTMYAQDENGQFVNNNWLSLPVP
jgi:hypothetical protein